MRINHAILHVFDFEAGNTAFSDAELDLSDRPTKSYVQRNLRKINASPESRHGRFDPDSPFRAQLENYFAGGCGFVDISVAVGDYLYEQMRAGTDIDQYDLLVADYEDDPDKSSVPKIDVADNYDGTGDGADFADAVDMAMAAALDAAYSAAGERKFALVLLPRKAVFAHDVRTEGGLPATGIVKHDATLPNPTQRIDSYAVIGASGMDIDFNDKPRVIAGAQTMLLPDGLLRCTAQASSKEVIQTVTSIVGGIAEEFGKNAAQAVSKAKAAMSRRAGEAEGFSPEELGREVFENEPNLYERYESETRRAELPDRVAVKRSVATRMARNHHIKTDTGIEITFPSEYCENTDYISFIREQDGSISIELKNIGHIENK